MKKLLLLSVIFLSSCCMHALCLPGRHHLPPKTPKILKGSDLEVRGAVYIAELY